MAARLSSKRLPRYSLQFKLGAVRLTQLPGMEVQAVAAALDIHPVMLSRWRQEAREGRLRGVAAAPKRKPAPAREVKRLQKLERDHALLQEEHELLTTAIRFCSERRRTSSPSSKRKAGASR